MLEDLPGTAGLITLVLGPLLALIAWVVKKLVPAVLRNMEANTTAIEANADATRAVADMLRTFIAAWNERDVRLFQQLDRIEENVKK